MPADMLIADAIMQAAKNVTGNGKEQHAIIAWLEMIRARDSALFNELIAKWRKELPSCPQK